MSNKSINVVANLIQLSRGSNGEFLMKPEQGEVLRTSVKPTRAYAEKMNRESANSGKFYVIDEEATAKNEADREAQRVERDSIEDAVQVGEELIDALIDVKAKKRKKKVKKD